MNARKISRADGAQGSTGLGLEGLVVAEVGGCGDRKNSVREIKAARDEKIDRHLHTGHQGGEGAAEGKGPS
jgi:hypothetical protein